jgi:hypothetical protein
LFTELSTKGFGYWYCMETTSLKVSNNRKKTTTKRIICNYKYVYIFEYVGLCMCHCYLFTCLGIITNNIIFIPPPPPHTTYSTHKITIHLYFRSYREQCPHRQDHIAHWLNSPEPGYKRHIVKIEPFNVLVFNTLIFPTLILII